MEAIHDLAALPNPTDDAIVTCLRERFLADTVYTSISSLIALTRTNMSPPHSVLHQYATEYREPLRTSSRSRPTSSSSQTMRTTAQDQSMLFRSLRFHCRSCVFSHPLLLAAKPAAVRTILELSVSNPKGSKLATRSPQPSLSSRPLPTHPLQSQTRLPSSVRISMNATTMPTTKTGPCTGLTLFTLAEHVQHDRRQGSSRKSLHERTVSVVPGKTILKTYGGTSADNIFPVQVSALCNGLAIGNGVSPYVVFSTTNNTDVNSQYHDFPFFTNDSHPDWCFESMVQMRWTPRVGWLGLTPKEIRTKANNGSSIGVYDGIVYDLTGYVQTSRALKAPAGQSSPGADTDFMSEAVVDIFKLNAGGDVTKDVNNLVGSGALTSDQLANQKVCLCNLFVVGKVNSPRRPERQGPGAQHGLAMGADRATEQDGVDEFCERYAAALEVGGVVEALARERVEQARTAFGLGDGDGALVTGGRVLCRSR
uniref:Glycosyltransferase family 2 protein n=1 Tax=Mycena chlorophos TaxID=658473 RepID=A0ABQ0LFI4_MYCCL|nr:glycosyltransferase family 2 protein [Mycena chlorophos]